MFQYIVISGTNVNLTYYQIHNASQVRFYGSTGALPRRLDIDKFTLRIATHPILPTTYNHPNITEFFVSSLSIGEQITPIEPFKLQAKIIDTDPMASVKFLIRNETWNTGWLHAELKSGYWQRDYEPILENFHNYTAIVYATDSTGLARFTSTTIEVSNNPPSIVVLEPAETELTIPQIYNIVANITDEDVVKLAQWDLVQTFGTYDWKNFTYNAIDELYEAQFNISEYQYGNWYLVINATDTLNISSLGSKLYEFHLSFSYTFDNTQVSYKNSGILITSNEEETTRITAQFTVNHHPIVLERDFECDIPIEFGDAYNYKIIRGFNTYTPEGFDPKGTHTEWHLPTSKLTDIVQFELEKPKLTNSISGVIEKEDGRFELEFSLSAKHLFTDLTIKHQLTQYFSKPENYNYILEYRFEDEWIDYTEDLLVDAGAFIKFEFKR